MGAKVKAARDAGNAATADQKQAVQADQQGDRETLKADSYIPATMAVIYLGLMLYFASIGGYKRVQMSA